MSTKPVCNFLKGMVLGMIIASCATTAFFSNKTAVHKMKNITSKACENVSTMFKMK